MRICPECLERHTPDLATCPADGCELLTLGDASDPRLGSLAHGYLFLDVLGAGGMGKVYRAWQRSMARPVAIKTLKPEVADAEGIARRFSREARLTARLKSPHTVTVHDFGRLEDDGSLFLVMELLDGDTLDHVYRRGMRMPLEEVREIGVQVCRSLSEAHYQGIVHRDLKPANIAFERRTDGEIFVKVLDFGIAKALDDATVALTGTGMAVGTLAYMSPEQIEGSPVTHAVDLYALGVTLFELAAGHRPFESKSRTALMFKHATEPPPPLTEYLATTPAALALDAILQRCLAKRPAARWPTAAALKAALEAWDVGEDAHLPPAPAPEGGAPQGATASPTPAREGGGEPGTAALATIDAPMATLASSFGSPQPTPTSHEPTGRRPAPLRRRWWPIPAALTALLMLVAWVQFFSRTEAPEDAGITAEAPAPPTASADVESPPPPASHLDAAPAPAAHVEGTRDDALSSRAIAAGPASAPRATPPPQPAPGGAKGPGACGEPVRGGTLRYYTSSLRGPFTVAGHRITADREFMDFFVLEPLRGDRELPLATRFELSADRLALDIEVRAGVRFHPHHCVPEGATVGAADLAFSLLHGMRGTYRGLPLDVHRPIETLGPRRVRAWFAHPMADDELEMVGYTEVIPAALEGCDDPLDLSPPVGTGPFRWVAAAGGADIRGVRFEGYWRHLPDGRALPLLDAVEVVQTDDLLAAMATTEPGRAHLISLGRYDLRGEPLETTETQAPLLRPGVDVSHLVVSRSPMPEKYLLIARLESGRTPAMDDVLFRRAVSLALDREAIAGDGPLAPVSSLLYPPMLGFDPVVGGRLRVDPEAVEATLSAAGFSGDTPRPRLIGVGNSKLAAPIRQALARFGLQVDLFESSGVDSPGIDLRLSALSYGADPAYPSRWLRYWARDQGREDLMDEIAVVGDRHASRAAREAKAREVEKALLETYRIVPLAYLPDQYNRRVHVTSRALCGVRDPRTGFIATTLDFATAWYDPSLEPAPAE